VGPTLTLGSRRYVRLCNVLANGHVHGTLFA
jgi:hypothetical protein